MQLAKIVTIKHIGVMRKAAYVVALLACITFVCSSVLYLSSGYARLVSWYYGLESCFYGSMHWNASVFTPVVKAKGNIYAVLGAVVAAYWGIYVARKLVARSDGYRGYSVAINFRTLIPVSILTVVVVTQWACANALTLPAFDEIFSAMNCAGKNLFQCGSYYMLPNNHVLFNLLNGLIFHFAEDKVATGRVMSLVMYEGVTLVSFFFFNKLFANRWLACLAAGLISMQFMTWGFGSQARGYEMYLLAQWGAWVSIYYYLLTGSRKWLTVNSFCVVVGYACMPSFVFYDVGQSVMVIVASLLYKDRQAAYWKHHAMALSLVFLFYLPALCFSGLGAFLDNKYVMPMVTYESRLAFMEWAVPYFRVWIHGMFSGFTVSGVNICFLLFLLPLGLFAVKRKEIKMLGVSYVCIWVTFFIVTYFLKRLSFERNMIAQYSFTLALVAVLLFYLLSSLPQIGRAALGRYLLFPLVLLMMCVHFTVTNYHRVDTDVYETNTNLVYRELDRSISQLPKGGVYGLSDDGFYFKYIADKRGLVCHLCPDGSEDHYVKLYYEPMPYKGYSYSGSCSLYQMYQKAR